jgi:hypothetical protein
MLGNYQRYSRMLLELVLPILLHNFMTLQSGEDDTSQCILHVAFISNVFSRDSGRLQVLEDSAYNLADYSPCILLVETFCLKARKSITNRLEAVTQSIAS